MWPTRGIERGRWLHLWLWLYSGCSISSHHRLCEVGEVLVNLRLCLCQCVEAPHIEVSAQDDCQVRYYTIPYTNRGSGYLFPQIMADRCTGEWSELLRPEDDAAAMLTLPPGPDSAPPTLLLPLLTPELVLAAVPLEAPPV